MPLDPAAAPSLDDLFEALATRGTGAYGLSDVTQLEHALQAAALAEAEGLGEAQTIAALFHDIGHLFEAEHDVDLAAQGIDDKHEDGSADVLDPIFGPAIARPVRLHVASKRYLCAVEPAYFDALAPDSVTSLALQGGPMSTAEVAAFEADPWFAQGVALRRIDDRAKTPGLAVPPLSAYRAAAERLAAARAG
ncbi:MAG: metal-dependent phosphohydrolase [Pseudomonadota bacterium]